MRSKTLKKIKSNYLFLIIGLAILTVGFYSFTKLIVSPSNYIYVKVKLGQGFWWANTQRPSLLQVNAISDGDISYSALGKPSAEVIGKRYYRYYGGDGFDVYLTLKINAVYNSKTGGYTFNRSSLAVGSPIELSFPTQEITGSVIAISSKPFTEKLIEKKVTIVKKNANAWEMDSIKVGDSFFDGENKVFEVISSRIERNPSPINVSNSVGVGGQPLVESGDIIFVELKILAKEISGQLVIGEDQVLTIGRVLNISTKNFIFDNYVVLSIE